ncbi:hypothetical protein [Zobellia roscoffensis]|uniref:hypothetical protein n=1 Tax=Zobellia roscoffensis TaxID=2779508 RepID=UPI00188AA808|nr:hypothetical protein [Zobellia roscoffensis]
MTQKNYSLKALVILIIIPLSFLTGCDSHPINELAEDLADQVEEIEELDDEPEDEEEQQQEQEEEEEEEEEEETVYTGSMTATANGKEFQSSEYSEQFNGMPAAITKTDGIYMVYISGYDISLGLANTKAVVLWAVGEDFSTLKVGKTWDSPLVDFLHEGVIANYYEAEVTDDDDDDNPNLEEVDNIYLKITAINFENQKFSGEFSFAGKTEDGTSITVTDGQFTDYTFEYNEQ